MDHRSRKRPSDLEPHRGREHRAGGPFCCERSESPAGGAALTICQRSLTLVFFHPPYPVDEERWETKSFTVTQ